MRKKLCRLMAVLMTFALLLTGCSGGSSTPAGNSGGNAGGSAPTGKIENGEIVVNVADSEQLTQLNPYKMANSGTYAYAEMIWDQLLLTDHMGNTEPGIITGYDISEDGLTVRMHVREGVKFSNGDLLDANDVYTTMKYILDNKETLATVVSVWKELVGVEKIDDYTVDIQLSAKKANLDISMGYVWVFSDELFEEHGEDMWDKGICIGTGPWKFVEWVDGQYVQFERNDDYWGEKSNVDRVYIRYLTENSTVVSSLISGDIDYANVQADLVPMLEGQDDIQVEEYTREMMYYLGLMTSKSPFDDVNARWALAHAIDREAIVEGIMGGGIPMNSNLTTNVDGYLEELEMPAYDPKLAKEYLAKSNYDGRTIELYTRYALINGEDVLVAVASYMEAVGFKVKINIVETATLVQVRKDAAYDIYLVNLGSYDMDPLIQYLVPVVVDDIYKTGYVNEELNAKITEANQEYDRAKRKALLEDVNRIMYEEQGPQIAMFQPSSFYGMRKGVEGLTISPASGTYPRNVYVDEAVFNK